MYRAWIRDNATGEVRVRDYDFSAGTLGSEGQEVWWWTEGNFGCDCNREWEFQRAVGEDESDDPPCGEARYSLMRLSGDGIDRSWPDGDRA